MHSVKTATLYNTLACTNAISLMCFEKEAAVAVC